jgi:sucrose-phosphate synthase
MLSIHGLIRGHDLELGRDADTGGQTKYVVDLARALARHPEVDQVDLVTRRVVDDTVSPDYAESEEALGDGARIIRIECGPQEYIAKEQLWDHLDAFTDNLTEWLNHRSRYPSMIHSHYADAGYVGVRLSNLLGVPLIHTGHSLGRDKHKQLLASGSTGEEIEQAYNMGRRIDSEEELLSNADLVITSTHNEIETIRALQLLRLLPDGSDPAGYRPGSIQALPGRGGHRIPPAGGALSRQPGQTADPGPVARRRTQEYTDTGGGFR